MHFRNQTLPEITSASPSKRSASAFTLTELLVVISLIVIMSAGATRLFSGFQANDHKRALVDIANAFETARQTATSRNTFTYVAFTSPTSNQDQNDPLCVATFESLSGSDVLRDGGAPADSGKWQLITRPVWLRRSMVEDQKDPPPGLVPVNEMNGVTQFSATIRPLSGSGFILTRKIGDMTSEASLKFNRVVTFSPNGTAMVDNSRGLPTALIGFLVKPCQGETPNAIESARVAAVTVGGFMGNVRFYQK